jgi:hypothetical protein
VAEKTIQFLQKLKDSGHWNDDYDYSKVEYINSNTKVIVIDKKFNTEHLITPSQLLKGSTCIAINLKDGWLNFEDARSFVKTLNLKNYTEWMSWCKSENKPHNIPTTPNIAYKDRWLGMGDWLGTGNINTHNHTFISFNEAKIKLKELGIKTNKEWREFVKNGKNIYNIPNSPDRVYSEWVSWNDFLNSDKLSNFREFLSFEDAKKYVQQFNITSSSEFKLWRKNNNETSIPVNPWKTYKNDGWVSWGDFLGTNIVHGKFREYLNFSDAKKYVQGLCLKSQTEWEVYSKSSSRPKNIPSHPHVIYKQEWKSMADWLGYIGDGNHQWTKQALIGFIKSLQNELTNLDSVELITIINSNNLAKKIRELGSLEDLVSSQGGTEERSNIVNNIITQLEGSSEESTIEEIETTITGEFEGGLSEGDVSEVTEEEDEPELEPLDPIQELRMYDNNMITASLDDENIDFLMKNQLKKLWNRVLNNKVDIEQFRNETGGEKFTIIKNWFFDEYEKVIAIKSPSDYIFKYQPNLMQKLITYRLISEKRYGNWSVLVLVKRYQQFLLVDMLEPRTHLLSVTTQLLKVGQILFMSIFLIIEFIQRSSWTIQTKNYTQLLINMMLTLLKERIII